VKVWITVDLIVGLAAQLYAIVAFVLEQRGIVSLAPLLHWSVAMAFGSAAMLRWYQERSETAGVPHELAADRTPIEEIKP